MPTKIRLAKEKALRKQADKYVDQLEDIIARVEISKEGVENVFLLNDPNALLVGATLNNTHDSCLRFAKDCLSEWKGQLKNKI